MMFGNNCQFDKEEIIEPKSKKATKKRKTTAMLLNEQNKRLSKLENQLEDLQRDNKELISVYESRITNQQEIMSYWEHKNEELKQQLAEKGQDKIDFAIEKLEKVKQWCSKYEEDLIDYEDGLVTKVIGLDDAIYIAEIGLYDFIDQQIKELKGEENV